MNKYNITVNKNNIPIKSCIRYYNSINLRNQTAKYRIIEWNRYGIYLKYYITK